MYTLIHLIQSTDSLLIKLWFLLFFQDPATIFEIQSKLGEGSYGSVFKAVDTRDGQLVAVKILEIGEDAEDLMQEIRILKNCNSRFIVSYKGPNLVPFTDLL